MQWGAAFTPLQHCQNERFRISHVSMSFDPAVRDDMNAALLQFLASALDAGLPGKLALQPVRTMMFENHETGASGSLNRSLRAHHHRMVSGGNSQSSGAPGPECRRAASRAPARRKPDAGRDQPRGPLEKA